MTFKFYCSSCGQKLSADEEMIGVSIECPSCGHSLIVKRPRVSQVASEIPISINKSRSSLDLMRIISCIVVYLSFMASLVQYNTLSQYSVEMDQFKKNKDFMDPVVAYQANENIWHRAHSADTNLMFIYAIVIISLSLIIYSLLKDIKTKDVSGFISALRKKWFSSLTLFLGVLFIGILTLLFMLILINSSVANS